MKRQQKQLCANQERSQPRVSQEQRFIRTILSLLMLKNIGLANAYSIDIKGHEFSLDDLAMGDPTPPQESYVPKKKQEKGASAGCLACLLFNLPGLKLPRRHIPAILRTILLLPNPST